MRQLRGIIFVRWHLRLLACLALALLATQFVALVHAVDADSHQGGGPCHICQVQQPGSAVPPPNQAPVAAQSFASDAVPVSRSLVVVPARYNRPPPSRAPPR